MDGKILFVNDYAFQISGYGTDEIKGMDVFTFVSPEDHERVIHNMPLMMENRLGPQEYQIITKDGSKIPVEINGDVLSSEDGIPFGLVFVCRDISERQRSEKILKEKEDRLHGITQNIPGIIYQFYATKNGEYGISYVSERLREIFGIQANLDDLLTVFTSCVHKEDRERFFAAIKETVAAVGSWNFEGRFVKPSGELLWFRSLATPTQQEDRLVFDGIILDVTEHKQAEELLRNSYRRLDDIIDFLPDATFVIDCDGKVITWNRSMELVTGIPKTDMLGRGEGEYAIPFYGQRRPLLIDLALLPDDVFVSNHYENIFRQGDILYAEAYVPQTYGGKGAFMWGVASRLRDSSGNIIGAIESIRDITERKHAEEERQKLEQQLFQAQKMESVGRLAGGVAHDFNNMLSIIIGNTEMALNGIDPAEPIHKSLQSILKAGMKSADLTRQLLAFARKQTVSPRVLDLNDAVTGMLKMLQRLIGENIDLGWHPGHNLWKVKIDPSQVDQLLANMTVNARDAMNIKAGKVIIETANKLCDEAYCSSRPEIMPGEYVLLAVSDDGCGMEKETLTKIFEPFFTTKREGEGTGLGLSTVYGIVKQNGGFINVYSEPGQGTTFRIYLPRHKAESPEVVAEKEVMELQGGTETILIVEDEEEVLNLTRGMLEMLGYKVLTARGADLALGLAGEHSGKIDLLLTDIVMPDMNGKELAERVIAVSPGLKCLYMSGYTADVIARQGILDEGVKFISKPFSLKDMAAKLREVLG